MSVTILHGDMLAVLPTLEAESFDACLTDPPYHLQSIHKRFAAKGRDETSERYAVGAYGRHATGFMGKQWDGGDIAARVETWAEVYRVLKPGAHLLAFGGTRTYHRMVCAIEDAGFEVRDTMGWLFGSGFPKSHDVSKGIDRAAGVEREVVGKSQWTQPAKSGHHGGLTGGHINESDGRFRPDVTAATSDEAKRWQGWGTALKPAMELICVARKPLGEKTVAANVLRYGCGAINVDACRVETTDEISVFSTSGGQKFEVGCRDQSVRKIGSHSLGRWPANVCHDGSEEVLRAFPQTVSGAIKAGRPYNHDGCSTMGAASGVIKSDFAASEGSAARFFYAAKADRQDRLASKHPTVKPVDLIRWLMRLVTPPGGVVLDCFAGSGTTGMAALAEGFNAVLVEREAEYVADIRKRVAHVEGADTPLFAEVLP